MTFRLLTQLQKQDFLVSGLSALISHPVLWKDGPVSTGFHIWKRQELVFQRLLEKSALNQHSDMSVSAH